MRQRIAAAAGVAAVLVLGLAACGENPQLLEGQRQRRDLRIDCLAGRRQPQHRAAAVAVVDLAQQAAVGEQARDRAADRDLVHRRAPGHLVGGQPGRAAQHRHHPPLGDAEREALGVDRGDRATDAVAEHRQPVGQEALEVQGRAATGHGSACNWFQVKLS